MHGQPQCMTCFPCVSLVSTGGGAKATHRVARICTGNIQQKEGQQYPVLLRGSGAFIPDPIHRQPRFQPTEQVSTAVTTQHGTPQHAIAHDGTPPHAAAQHSTAHRRSPRAGFGRRVECIRPVQKTVLYGGFLFKCFCSVLPHFTQLYQTTDSTGGGGLQPVLLR